MYLIRTVYDLIEAHGPVLSKRLKELGNYKKGGNKGFDTIITRLQKICPHAEEKDIRRLLR